MTRQQWLYIQLAVLLIFALGNAIGYAYHGKLINLIAFVLCSSVAIMTGIRLHKDSR